MPPKCNQCDSATINGVYCHEHGCPNINKIWDEENELWIPEEEFFADFTDDLFSDEYLED